MKQQRHSIDQIIGKLRRADVELGKGKKVPDVCKILQITEQGVLPLASEVWRRWCIMWKCGLRQKIHNEC